MRVAILSESPADEEAIHIIAEAVLDRAVEVVTRRGRASGWSGALRAIPPVLRQLHYHRAGEALIVVIDSNSSPVHSEDDKGDCANADKCRYCAARKIVAETQRYLKPLEGRPAIKVAVGLAVPAIEGWYLCGRNPNVSENAWILGMAENRRPYTNMRLKEMAYGTDRPPLLLETEIATSEMRRVVADLDSFQNKFPRGFGLLRRELSSWV